MIACRRHGACVVLAILVTVGPASGCRSAERTRSIEDDASADEIADASSPAEDAGAPDGATRSCTTSSIDLVVLRDGDIAARLYAPIALDGLGDALLLVDTGSELTFLFLGSDGPAYVERAGMIDIGCERLPIAGRNVGAGEAIGGREVVGILGTDYFLGAPSEIDLREGRAVRYLDGDAPREGEAFAALAYEDRLGHILVDAIVDETPLHLMLDTGAPHILWLGEAGRPGDDEVTTADAKGHLLSLWLGPSTLELAKDAPREVGVLRAPSFPYFEETVRALGGGIDGLLGLSALGLRRVIIAPGARVMRLEPLASM